MRLKIASASAYFFEIYENAYILAGFGWFCLTFVDHIYIYIFFFGGGGGGEPAKHQKAHCVASFFVLWVHFLSGHPKRDFSGFSNISIMLQDFTAFTGCVPMFGWFCLVLLCFACVCWMFVGCCVLFPIILQVLNIF